MISNHATTRRAAARERFLRQRDAASARTMRKRGRTAVGLSAIVLASAMRQTREQRWGRR